MPVKLAFDIKTVFDTSNTDSFNVIAEIPGAAKPNEMVMVGGHFDSWHMGTGATDNAAGSAVAMEVMRILKSLNLKMDRTVRMALWGGEEEGLLGSAAYVKEHFADPATMKPTAEHDGFAGYFNIDNGTGRIRGIYLQQNEMVRPIFEQWFAALKDITPGTITIRNTGGTDHQSYERVGLPGFQFIQDPMDYDTRTHHSNMDVYDRIQARTWSRWRWWKLRLCITRRPGRKSCRATRCRFRSSRAGVAGAGSKPRSRFQGSRHRFITEITEKTRRHGENPEQRHYRFLLSSLTLGAAGLRGLIAVRFRRPVNRARSLPVFLRLYG